MSDRTSTAEACTCSGDMYATVPITVPGLVAPGDALRPSSAPAGIRFARPKSRIFTRPSAVTKTFSGLRSRWTIPFRWAAARPWAIWTAKERACPRVGSRRPSTSRSVSPSSSSVTT
jgi:hypothetical protein